MLIAAVTSLTALMLLVFGGGSGFEEAFDKVFSRARSAAVDVVKDKERRKAIRTVLDDNVEEIQAIDRVLVERRLEFWQVDADYETTLADYERVVEWLDGAWADGFDKLVDLRAAIIEQMTAEEWQKLQERLHKKAGKAHPTQPMAPGTHKKDED
jgi:hypothetical protein